MRKYTYYMFNKKVNGVECKCIAAVTHCKGAVVRGVATCNPEDVYDEEKGKTIARIKCDIKVNERRQSYLRVAHDYAIRDAQMVAEYMRKISAKLADATADVENLKAELSDVTGL